MCSATSPAGGARRATSTSSRCSSMRQATRHKAASAWVQVGDGSHLELHHTPWWRHITCDFRRYRVTADDALRTIFLTQGFWASCVYRTSRAALESAQRFAPLVRPLVAIAQKLVEVLTGICLPPQCEIGDGLYIGHYGSLIPSPHARRGPKLSLAANGTLGGAGGARSARAAPHR